MTGAGKVLESFPPGSQISFAPESRNEADFNSAIAGFEVNAQYYFHKNDLQYDDETTGACRDCRRLSTTHNIIALDSAAHAAG